MCYVMLICPSGPWKLVRRAGHPPLVCLLSIICCWGNICCLTTRLRSVNHAGVFCAWGNFKHGNTQHAILFQLPAPTIEKHILMQCSQRFPKESYLQTLCSNIWSDWQYVSITPATTNVKGGYTGFTSYIRLSVRLWTKSCPLCIFHTTSRIHFIFAYLIKQLQKVCHV